MTDYIATGACIDGDFRYELTRSWGDGPVCTFIMLNPSTADADQDDPTIRRCVGFAKALGCGSLCVVNLYAYRATNPRDVFRQDGRVGPKNDYWLSVAAVYADVKDSPLIAAWGAHAEEWRVQHVLTLPGMQRLTALGVTKDGHPRHPLYLPASARPEPWPMDRAVA